MSIEYRVTETAGTEALEVRGAAFDVRKTLDCGQAFRFAPDDASGDFWTGSALGRRVRFFQTKEHIEKDVFYLPGMKASDFEDVWYSYLALDEHPDDMSQMILDAMPNDGARCQMKEAIDAGYGIHILRQDSFEAIISFLISQNNNIPRIKNIISGLVKSTDAGDGFPSPDEILDLGFDGLNALRMGYRVSYLLDASERVKDGRLDIEKVKTAPYEEAAKMLSSVKGVGPKVCACALLFGFHRTEAFPVDTWMRKALARRFPDGIDVTKFGTSAGLAQQYLFYAERENGN